MNREYAAMRWYAATMVELAGIDRRVAQDADRHGCIVGIDCVGPLVEAVRSCICTMHGMEVRRPDEVERLDVELAGTSSNETSAR